MAPALTDPSAQSFKKLPTKLHPPDIDPSLIQPETKQFLDKYCESTVDWNKKLSNSKYFKELSVSEQGILQRALTKSFGNSLNSSSKIQRKVLRSSVTLPDNIKENISQDCFENMNQPSGTLNGVQENDKQKDTGNLSSVQDKLASLKECKNSVKETLVEDFQTLREVEKSDVEMVASDNNIDTIDIVGNTDLSMARELEEENVKTEEELSAEVGQKQHALERRNQHLIRRLRRLQARQLEMHCRNQIGSFVSFQRRNLQTVANKSIGMQNVAGTQSELKAELLKSEDVKNLSTSALVNLVRKIQATHANLNRRLATQMKSREDREGLHLTSVLNIDSEVSAESARVAGHLSTNMHHMHNAFDSDATESSSGGESCDEYDDYEQERKVPPPPL